MHSRGVSPDEGPDPAGGTHHQQRVDLSVDAAAKLGGERTKHAVTGLTKSAALDGRKYDIACSQIDIGNADTPLTARMKEGVLQANGTTAAEPTMDVDHVARAVVYMAGLPLSANVLFMTVMATQMPLVGRG